MNNHSQNRAVMSSLVGKTIRKVFISRAEDVLIVFHDEGHCYYETYGDCCSETWIADLVGVENLLGHKVLEVEDVAMEDVDDGRTRQEYDQFFGIKIVTTGGYVDIIYRNSSNGYYGGSLYEVTSDRGFDLSDMAEITEDYSA